MGTEKEKKMNPAIKQSRHKAAFTIVELLTVMSIIVILIGLLVPALNNVKRYAKEVRQKAQFHSIEAAIELFSNEFDGYPSSSALDGHPTDKQPYCGAMKLCEAMMGQDLMGFHPDSDFIRNGTDRAGRALYVPDTLTARRPPYLPLENANAYKLRDIYGPDNVNPFLPDIYVLCDVYTRQVKTGMKVGMPILYYKADTSYSLHDPNTSPTPTDNKGNIYNYWDNQMLVMLGKPWEEGLSDHALRDPERFYKNTRNHKIRQPARPYRADTYILISAGFDGEYGTADDICNYEWKYTE
jgi:type II secretory pathway pseudopilin PulG